MIVAVVGCLHGKLEFLYEELQQWEKSTHNKVDFIICSGDFQSIRDKVDLEALECPPKYKEMGQFQRFYKQEIRAPILTIFIGGNHEATNYLRDLYYGGWVAENIYYLGASGVVNICKGDQKLRVGGVSGIDKHYDYLKGYYEKWPYVNDRDGLRSIYHVRQFDIQKLNLVNQPLDIFISHEWPTLATSSARKDQIAFLTRIKPHFRDEISRNSLGSKNLSQLMMELRPRFWFSAHMHVKFNSVIQLEQGYKTEFLSLDKPLPKRQYLDVFSISNETQSLQSIFRNNNQSFNNKQQSNQMVYRPKQKLPTMEEIENELKELGKHEEEEEKVSQSSDIKFTYDPEWLAILQSTQSMIPLENKKYDFRHLNKSENALMEDIQKSQLKLASQDIEIRYNPDHVYSKYERLNPQTKEFIERFELDSRLFEGYDSLKGISSKDKDEFTQQKSDMDSLTIGKRTFDQAFVQKQVKDDNEIDLDDI